jgi:HEAT repeat protein
MDRHGLVTPPSRSRRPLAKAEPLPYGRGSDRRRGWLAVAAFLSLMLILAVGCVERPVREKLSPDELAAFRDDAVKFLQDAAFSDEPPLRVNAIEALADVAPREGLQAFDLNLENEYAGASFAALMAVGSIRHAALVERVRTRAEHADANVRIAALYALHRLGDRHRTGELGDLLLNHRDARVRANAALAVGRLGEPSSTTLLHRALRHEKKEAPKLNILEALAIMGDKHATERLIFAGYSAYPDQATFALQALANARSPEAEELFRDRLETKGFPEINLAAARGLGRLGDESGLTLALARLKFDAPQAGRPNDPPAQQISRIRGLAALACEAIGNPDSLPALREAFYLEGQPAYVRLATARAAIRIIDSQKPATSRPQSDGSRPRTLTATQPGAAAPHGYFDVLTF